MESEGITPELKKIEQLTLSPRKINKINQRYPGSTTHILPEVSNFLLGKLKLMRESTFYFWV